MEGYPGYRRCRECEYDYDQCYVCAQADRDEKEHQRNTAICDESGGRVLAKDCRLKATGVKIDSCSACGYKFIYP